MLGVHTTHSHDQLTKCTSNMTMHVTKLPIKHYKAHMTTKLHGETRINPVPANLVRFTNVGLLSSSSTLVVLTSMSPMKSHIPQSEK